MKEKILQLQSEGLTYAEIVAELKCSKSLVAYYCNKTSKNKLLESQRKRRGIHSLVNRTSLFKGKKRKDLSDKSLSFQRDRKTGEYRTESIDSFNWKDVLKKFESNPKCYLTGREIDLSEPSSYHLDHIIPCVQGGSNGLDNMGLTCKEANIAKNGFTLEQFIDLCKEVLTHNGYKVANAE